MNHNHKQEQKSQDYRAATKENSAKDINRSANHNSVEVTISAESGRQLSENNTYNEHACRDVEDSDASHHPKIGEDRATDKDDYKQSNSEDADLHGAEANYLDDESLRLAEYLPLELRRIITYYLPRYSQRLSENLRSILSDKWFITLIDLDVNGHLKIGFSWDQEELCITLAEVSAGDNSDSDYPNLLTSSTNLIRVLKGLLNPQIALLNGQISYQGNNQVLYILNVFSAINCRHIIRTIERELEEGENTSSKTSEEQEDVVRSGERDDSEADSQEETSSEQDDENLDSSV